LVLSFVTNVGGLGGFFASVRAIGVVHPPGINVSAELTVRGGADGSFFCLGGGTNPGSVEPSFTARDVPVQRVNAINEFNAFMFLFIIRL
jgi:hypothetical protein